MSRCDQIKRENRRREKGGSFLVNKKEILLSPFSCSSFKDECSVTGGGC
jgi:hypothetical protein